MKKSIIASLAGLGCAAVLATLALGGGSKLNAIFETKATGKSFVFAAATGSQFDEDKLADEQTVNVETGSTDPIRTTFNPLGLGSLAFGQDGRFVEAHPSADEYCGYFVLIGINNLTHFEIDMGVENDVGTGDRYTVELRDQYHSAVKEWTYSSFELDGTAHLEWHKEPTDGTVVEVYVGFSFKEDSAATNLYIESITLSWDC